MSGFQMTLRDELPDLVAVPDGVTAGIAVFDRDAGRFVQQYNPDHRFRSASVVKLLIALDYLWNRAPAYDVPAADRDRLEVMLRSSDDDAASHYWDELGGAALVDRMVKRLGLTHTSGPPATHPGFWGYVAITAADTVRIYRYLLDQAPEPVRAFVMDLLHRPTRYGTDGFDQFFGIPSAFERDFSIKQGWSGFQGSSGYGSDRVKPRDHAVDLHSDALHTTGTVGLDDRTIVAVYTLHPRGTPYEKAYAEVTRLTEALTVPGVPDRR
ncbi:serine hydrolase [Kribbella swartbergensis]